MLVSALKLSQFSSFFNVRGELAYELIRMQPRRQWGEVIQQSGELKPRDGEGLIYVLWQRNTKEKNQVCYVCHPATSVSRRSHKKLCVSCQTRLVNKAERLA